MLATRVNGIESDLTDECRKERIGDVRAVIAAQTSVARRIIHRTEAVEGLGVMR